MEISSRALLLSLPLFLAWILWLFLLLLIPGIQPAALVNCIATAVATAALVAAVAVATAASYALAAVAAAAGRVVRDSR